MTDAVADSYVASRARFVEAAGRRGWACSEYPVGEGLFIDAALSPGNGPSALVVSSGMHGVEGPFGSAIQSSWIESAEVTGGVRLIFLHALNPYGFAHSRRFDAENIDPNRNFLLEGEAFEGSPPGYAELDPLLNPPGPPRFDGFLPRAMLRVARHGMAALKQSVAVGQYDYPLGLFFGGHGPSSTQRFLGDRLPAWIEGASRVVHLDIHTGLGPWGTWKLLVDHPLDDDQRRWLIDCHGPDSFEGCDSGPTAYQARGSLGPWCRERFPGRSYLALCAEFGTYGPITVLAGLRKENQAQHWCAEGARARAKAVLRELFYPRSPSWRSKAIAEGVGLIDRSISGLRRSFGP